MSFTVVATEEPTEIIAGDSMSWTIVTDNSDFYPSANYVLTYSLRGTAGAYDITSITDPTDSNKHLVELTAAITALYKSGVYYWDAYVTKASTSERYTIKSSKLTVLPNLNGIATAAAIDDRHDGRSLAKLIVDACDATILEKVIDDAQTQQVLGSMIIKGSADQIMRVRSIYYSIYLEEEKQNAVDRGEDSGTIHYVRFF